MKKIVLALLFLPALFSCESRKTADLIIHNGVIYTIDEAYSTASAFAVIDGKFAAIGSDEEIFKNYLSENVIDVQQRTIYPGFYDAHCHFYGLGLMSEQLDLTGMDSKEEIVRELQRFRKKHPNSPWLLGRGWDQNLWEDKSMPDADFLSEAFPTTPVYLVRIDGHAALANETAVKLSAVQPGTEVSGGEAVTKNGKLTGLFIDAATDLLSSKIPEPSLKKKIEMLTQAQNLCFSKGLTTVSDAGLDKATVMLIDSLQKAEALSIRLYAMLSPTEENKKYFLEKGPYKTDRLNVRSFKFYADGALGSRGALLLKPYADAPGEYGFPVTAAKDLDRDLKLMYEKGFQANVHCIGDSANRQVLNMYGKYLKGTNDLRWRIEHAQVIHPDDMPKFKKYSVIPSVQPTHCTSDMLWAPSRLGAERVKTAYPYLELMKANGYIALGSDFPVEDVNPIYTYHAAVSRQNAEHEPDEGFLPENVLDPESTLRGMTIWAAKANFEENERGSIETGKMADFIISDTDLADTDFRLLRLSRILNTFVAGKKVFSNYESGY